MGSAIAFLICSWFSYLSFNRLPLLLMLAGCAVLADMRVTCAVVWVHICNFIGKQSECFALKFPKYNFSFHCVFGLSFRFGFIAFTHASDLGLACGKATQLTLRDYLRVCFQFVEHIRCESVFASIA